jgi:hypothetical protein
VGVLKRYGQILRQGIEKFYPVRKNSDPEYYNREVKHLKVNVRKAHNRRMLGHQYRE